MRDRKMENKCMEREESPSLITFSFLCRMYAASYDVENISSSSLSLSFKVSTQIYPTPLHVCVFFVLSSYPALSFVFSFLSLPLVISLPFSVSSRWIE